MFKKSSLINYMMFAHFKVLNLCTQNSSFVAPERPTIKIVDKESKAVEGREDQMYFSNEYIPPLVRPEWHRNKLNYRLQRMDCIRRRKVIDIPEFYPGSILAITIADQFAPGKFMKFVGRCLYRDGFGVGCKFALRNVLDGEGVEVIYHLYSPLLQQIEVLRLEKWLDTDLRFLRDADQSYCTIDPNMQAEAPLPNSEELPIFKEKIKMKSPDQWMYNYHKSFPRPYNAFIEEHFLEDEWVGFNRVNLDRSHLKYDICRHYDVTKMKPEITQEMTENIKRVENADKPNNNS